MGPCISSKYAIPLQNFCDLGVSLLTFTLTSFFVFPFESLQTINTWEHPVKIVVTVIFFQEGHRQVASCAETSWKPQILFQQSTLARLDFALYVFIIQKSFHIWPTHEILLGNSLDFKLVLMHACISSRV